MFKATLTSVQGKVPMPKEVNLYFHHKHTHTHARKHARMNTQTHTHTPVAIPGTPRCLTITSILLSLGSTLRLSPTSSTQKKLRKSLKMHARQILYA
mmetsp:Transcript_8707/g.23404  ORF Transcript_8707/g.23404 Transcript_8707/m.23404 type:complete len:97 (-) Transcript_8707:767-1057(-)